jgi:hypothetical protein
VRTTDTVGFGVSAFHQLSSRSPPPLLCGGSAQCMVGLLVSCSPCWAPPNSDVVPREAPSLPVCILVLSLSRLAPWLPSCRCSAAIALPQTPSLKKRAKRKPGGNRRPPAVPAATQNNVENEVGDKTRGPVPLLVPLSLYPPPSPPLRGGGDKCLSMRLEHSVIPFVHCLCSSGPKMISESV